MLARYAVGCWKRSRWNVALIVVGICWVCLAALGSAGDQDDDGMPDEWEIANGTNPAVNDSEGDLDLDEWPNIYEYVHGSNPNSAASEPVPDVIATTDSISAWYDDVLVTTPTLSSLHEGVSLLKSLGGYAIMVLEPGEYEQNLAVRGDISGQPHYRCLITSTEGPDNTILFGTPNVQNPPPRLQDSTLFQQ